MPRLRNRVSGVVVNVDDDTAARLGAAYEVADEQPKRSTTKKSSASKSKK